MTKEMVAQVEVVPEAVGVVVRVGAEVSKTVRVRVVVLASEEEVAVIVITAGPREVEGWVVRVRVKVQFATCPEPAEGVQETGEKEAVMPVGSPEAEKAREAGVPLTRVAVTVMVAELP